MVKRLEVKPEVNQRPDRAILDELKTAGIYNPTDKYRGIRISSEDEIERIMREGTDRTLDGQEEQIKRLMEVQRYTPEEAALSLDPNYTWVNGEDRLIESIDWISGSLRKGILVYKGESLTDPENPYSDEMYNFFLSGFRKFAMPPSKALKAIVTLK